MCFFPQPRHFAKRISITMLDTSRTYADATLASCESEQLHLSGRIQDFGALLVVSLETRCVTHVSANAPTLLGLSPRSLLGATLSALDLYTPEFDSAFDLEAGAQTLVANVMLGKHQHLNVTLIRTLTALLMEWEPAEPQARPIAIHQMHRNMVRAPSHQEGAEPYYETLVNHVQHITGMDRVMIYRFRDDWTGEVVAERVGGEYGSYMGMRFPAGDIPEIARKLYLQNPYRMIPDVSAAVHPVYSLQAEPPDLSASDLRSVSPMHLQYMENMGVRASFSVPICIMGKLWGLVACHHYQGAKRLSQDQRHACVTLVAAFSLGLASYFAGMHLQTLDSMDRRIQLALQAFVGLTNPLDGVGAFGPALADLVRADGFAMAIDEEAAISGCGPDLEGLSVIDDWFLNHADDYSVSMESMAERFEARPEVCKASCGLLAFKIWTSNRGWLRFYWFRQQETQQITWAGNPDKPRAENSAAPHLSPRRSFEKWVETRTGFCREWLADEKLMAAKFRSTAGRML
jgi:chemotaxis family two-component system sensor kinase Cph1